MIAAHDREKPSRVGKGSFLHLFYPGPKNTYRYFVFRLACRGTGMAANALSVVNNKSVTHNVFAFLKLPDKNMKNYSY
jgi:hypothetical protein